MDKLICTKIQAYNLFFYKDIAYLTKKLQYL